MPIRESGVQEKSTRRPPDSTNRSKNSGHHGKEEKHPIRSYNCGGLGHYGRDCKNLGAGRLEPYVIIAMILGTTANSTKKVNRSWWRHSNHVVAVDAKGAKKSNSDNEDAVGSA
jgi:hypothetical protein